MKDYKKAISVQQDLKEDYQKQIDKLMKEIAVHYQEMYEESACSQWRDTEDDDEESDNDEKHD